VEFSVDPSAVRARREVREFLDRRLDPDMVAAAHESGTMHDWAFHRALAEEGWIAAPWPVDAGGRGYGPMQMFEVIEEMTLARAPIDGWSVTMNVAGTLLAHAAPSLVEEVVPVVLAGDAIVCLGLTEPDAGSDVASVSTRARPAGVPGGEVVWTVDGQKMFTTLAHEARWVFLLTRTGADAARHRGLTVFLVPLDRPGVEIQPVGTLGGERTNITFYSGVQIEDRYRVGPVDGGWSILMHLLGLERGGQFGAMSIFTGSLGRLLLDSARWASTREPGGHRPVDDPLVATRLGRTVAESRVASMLSLASAYAGGSGRPAVVEASMAKLYTSEALQRAASSLLDLLGPAGLLPAGAGGEPAGGWIEHAHRHAPVTTIYGGTSEVMRSIVAGQGLRLPAGT
jgi:alkylation response protein AidB-like acyl-CoA dehydrogenase